MTDERLAELRALSKKPPPGPWKFIEEEDRIYASRIAVPELLDEIARLRERIDRVRRALIEDSYDMNAYRSRQRMGEEVVSVADILTALDGLGSLREGDPILPR